MTRCMAPVDHASRLRESLGVHSVDADTQVKFLRLAREQAALPIDYLYQRQSELFGPGGMFARFSAQVTREGRRASVFADIMKTKPRQRLKDAQKAVEFAMARLHERSSSPNPFRLCGRESLCCVVYDESDASLVERYAAYEAMRQLDSDFFIKLIATTRGVVERRIVFRGLLEHFDRLMPIEQSIYPENYREVQQGHLRREEAMYGPLRLEKSLNELLRDVPPARLLEQLQGKANLI